VWQLIHSYAGIRDFGTLDRRDPGSGWACLTTALKRRIPGIRLGDG
jgi:hypothetical protein